MSTPVLPKGHEEFSALAVAWAIDALEPADQERFEAHRVECDDCERTVRDALKVAAELAYGVPDIAPPPSLRLRLLAAVVPEPPFPEVSSEHRQASAPGVAGRPGDDPEQKPTLDRPLAPGPALDRPADPERPDTPARPTAPQHPDTPGRPTELDRPSLSERPTTPNRPNPRTGPSTSGTTPIPVKGTETGRDGADAGPGRLTGSNTDRPLAPGPALDRPADPELSDTPAHGDDGDQDDSADRYGRHAAVPLARTPGTGRDGWRAGTDARHLIDRDGQHGGRPRSMPDFRRSRRSRRQLASVLAAAALVSLSAVTTWQVTRPAPVSAPTASADRVVALTSTDGNRAVATVVIRDGRVDVVTDGLPTTTATTAYYVWGVPAGDAGIPQVVGTFEVTEKGLHSYPVRLTRTISDYPVLAVSQEASGSMPATPSDILARGALS